MAFSPQPAPKAPSGLFPSIFTDAYRFTTLGKDGLYGTNQVSQFHGGDPTQMVCPIQLLTTENLF